MAIHQVLNDQAAAAGQAARARASQKAPHHSHGLASPTILDMKTPNPHNNNYDPQMAATTGSQALSRRRGVSYFVQKTSLQVEPFADSRMISTHSNLQ